MHCLLSSTDDLFSKPYPHPTLQTISTLAFELCPEIPHILPQAFVFIIIPALHLVTPSALNQIFLLRVSRACPHSDPLFQLPFHIHSEALPFLATPILTGVFWFAASVSAPSSHCGWHPLVFSQTPLSPTLSIPHILKSHSTLCHPTILCFFILM